ncbi:hypothetical protein G6F64_015252 [Rhizopus arrhizus]|uniref:HTH lysR-type domain-containing protein n=1 Tax=Rhizopus oryzae TaxID=64495 RepID=A0A9P6WRW6_RHIOR|nr:hypothetical protein G6F64_015252 [Rhizopus arrhizus]
MLNSRLLRQFIAVAEELHYGRAALRVGIAQSPLSQAIQKLESHVGTPLFVRNKRSVALTPAGAPSNAPNTQPAATSASCPWGISAAPGMASCRP